MGVESDCGSYHLLALAKAMPAPSAWCPRWPLRARAAGAGSGQLYLPGASRRHVERRGLARGRSAPFDPRGTDPPPDQRLHNGMTPPPASFDGNPVAKSVSGDVEWAHAYVGR